MNRRNDTSDRGGDLAGSPPARNGQRVLGILIALVVAVAVVWAWNEYGQPGLKSLIKALFSD